MADKDEDGKWTSAANSVNQRYKVFGKQFWYKNMPESDDKATKKKKSRQYHGARAKLVLANIFTVGLVNLAMLIRYRIGDPQTRQAIWEKHVKSGLVMLSIQVAKKYNLKEDEFRAYFKYVFFGKSGNPPEVRPSTDQAFARGWSDFVDDYGDQLQKWGMSV